MKAFEVGTHYSKSEFPDVWPFCNCLHYSIIFVNFSSIFFAEHRDTIYSMMVLGRCKKTTNALLVSQLAGSPWGASRSFGGRVD
jgi:hypothetical protein